PRSMQTKPSYDDVVLEVAEFLKKRRSEAEELGIGRECIVFDPGIGFGKRLEHNLALMTRVRELVELGSPILIGASRKSFLRDLAGIDDAKDRLPGSLAAAVMTRMGGASIFRVHDVAATKQALAVADAGLNSQI
ncbi:MAG: dihydropteroate synthase, partial [Candidatus Eisenbacteria bacterium]|nr:dihydropteroate synthase [Candidatus Eisenbacteria bacterium]